MSVGEEGEGVAACVRERLVRRKRDMLRRKDSIVGYGSQRWAVAVGGRAIRGVTPSASGAFDAVVPL